MNIINNLVSLMKHETGPLPTGYTQLSYCENANSKKAYLTTGVIPKRNTWFEIDYSLTQLSGNDTTNVLFGTANASTGRPGYMLFVYAASGNVNVRISNSGNVQYTATGVVHDTNRHKIRFENDLLYIDDNAPISGTPDLTQTLSYTLTLFIRHQNNAYLDTAQPKMMRCYSFKLWDANGDIANLIPAKRNADGIIGMYDTVNDVFRSSIGTDQFTGA